MYACCQTAGWGQERQSWGGIHPSAPPLMLDPTAVADWGVYYSSIRKFASSCSVLENRRLRKVWKNSLDWHLLIDWLPSNHSCDQARGAECVAATGLPVLSCCGNCDRKVPPLSHSYWSQSSKSLKMFHIVFKSWIFQIFQMSSNF